MQKSSSKEKKKTRDFSLIQASIFEQINGREIEKGRKGDNPSSPLVTFRHEQRRMEARYATMIFDLDRTIGDPVSGLPSGEKVRARNYYHNGESSRVQSCDQSTGYRFGRILVRESLRPLRSHREWLLLAFSRADRQAPAAAFTCSSRLLRAEAESTSWFLRGTVHRRTAVKCLLNASTTFSFFPFFELRARRKTFSLFPQTIRNCLSISFVIVDQLMKKQFLFSIVYLKWFPVFFLAGLSISP